MVVEARASGSEDDVLGAESHNTIYLSLAWFKDSAESETSRPSRIRLGPLRDESESRVGRFNS